MTSDLYVTRLAPAPTGALHLGNARTFLITWLKCRHLGGKLILRMEDLDHPKVKPLAAAGAYQDLAWLGMDWDEGPAESVGKTFPDDPFVQSNRHELYNEVFERLLGDGKIYPCWCSRKDIEAAQSAPHAGEEMRYPNTCRNPPQTKTNKEPSWRFRIEDGRETAFTDAFCGKQKSVLSDWSGDFVVASSRGKVSYQLAVVVDDAAMGVTEVVRADDLLPSTHRQLVLYETLGLTPPGFMHLPLVVGPDGRRLAKRHGDTRIGALRQGGTTPEQIVGWLGFTCGWAEWGESVTVEELLKRFDPATIPQTTVTVDANAVKLLSC